MELNRLELARKYWKTYIEDYLGCYNKEISEKDMERVLSTMFNEDWLWERIEEAISECLIDLEVEIKEME